MKLQSRLLVVFVLFVLLLSKEPNGPILASASSLDLSKKEKDKKPLREIPSDTYNIDGYYIVRGEESGGKPYSGIAVIEKKNQVYVVTWVIGTGNSFTGIGIRSGGNLAVSWVISSEKGLIRGINLYRIENYQGKPRLSGTWSTLPGNGVQQKETLKFLKEFDPPDEKD